MRLHLRGSPFKAQAIMGFDQGIGADTANDVCEHGRLSGFCLGVSILQ